MVNIMDHIVMKDTGDNVIHQNQQTKMPGEKEVPVHEEGGEEKPLNSAATVISGFCSYFSLFSGGF